MLQKYTREHNTCIGHDQRIFFYPRERTHFDTGTLIKECEYMYNTIKTSIKIKIEIDPHNANTHKLVTRNDIS